ncbi:hypothetical protein MP638_001086 [Amoeboaphelidium occidentale]|nr:hypothetical protein MP638_001086 [Amoeboaphelidium occidentale]
MTQQKLAPIIISTSRGMGKSFLLKKLGANDLGTSESIIELEQARLNGRTISLTANVDTVNEYKCDYELWLKDVFLRHLSHIFYGYSFREVCFDAKRLNPLLQDLSEASPSFQKFAGHVKSRSVMEVFDLVMDWTREAFNITSEVRLVILIDEMQHLLVDMNIKSSVYSGNHTFLSLAFSCLKMRRPIIIMTGTNAGELEMMNDYSDVNPHFVGLSLFELEDSRLFRTLLFQNFGKTVSWTEDDKRLSQAIQTLSAGVPRLLRIGYDSWIRLIESFSFRLIIQSFFVNARSYYKEATDYVRNDSKISDEDLAMVMLCYNSFFQVREIGNYVPGTKISWRQLIHASVVFPCGNSCYCIPSIFWLPKDNEDSDEKIFKVNSLIKEELVPGVDLKVMNLDVLAWCDDSNNWLTPIGHYFETLFGMSLAIRHYLKTYDHRRRKLVKFSDIYFVRRGSYFRGVLDGLKVNLKDGFCFTEEGCSSANKKGLVLAVYCNQTVNSTARFDSVIPMDKGFICIQNKNSVKKPSAAEIIKQLEVLPENSVLVWVYLGQNDLGTKEPVFNNKVVKNAIKDNKLMFLSSAGCCSPVILSLLRNLKGVA